MMGFLNLEVIDMVITCNPDLVIFPNTMSLVGGGCRARHIHNHTVSSMQESKSFHENF